VWNELLRKKYLCTLGINFAAIATVYVEIERCSVVVCSRLQNLFISEIGPHKTCARTPPLHKKRSPDQETDLALSSYEELLDPVRAAAAAAGW
jgi:hypothetical protein